MEGEMEEVERRTAIHHICFFFFFSGMQHMTIINMGKERTRTYYNDQATNMPILFSYPFQVF